MLAKLKNGSDPDHFANTNWNDAIFQTGHLTQHNLTARGGTKNTHYMISLGYQNQKGIIISTGNDRYNFRSNVDTKVGFLTLGLNLSGSADQIHESTTGIAGPLGGTPYKPVGLVYIGVSTEMGLKAEKMLLGEGDNDRKRIRELATAAALYFALKAIGD